MKYSIIIPTMWFHVTQLQEMLSVYDSMNSVGEILVIDNDNTKTPELNFNKLRIISKGENLYVNPSWKFGIEESRYNNVILANDDIIIQGDINRLFELTGFLLNKGVVIGPNEKCYTGINCNDIKFNKVESGVKMNYGFGVFMFMKKETFLNTPIPNNILVWRGDRILHLQNKIWNFEGIEIVTGMSGTTSKLDLGKIAAIEKIAFRKYLKRNKLNK